MELGHYKLLAESKHLSYRFFDPTNHLYIPYLAFNIYMRLYEDSPHQVVHLNLYITASNISLRRQVNPPTKTSPLRTINHPLMNISSTLYHRDGTVSDMVPAWLTSHRTRYT